MNFIADDGFDQDTQFCLSIAQTVRDTSRDIYGSEAGDEIDHLAAVAREIVREDVESAVTAKGLFDKFADTHPETENWYQSAPSSFIPGTIVARIRAAFTSELESYAHSPEGIAKSIADLIHPSALGSTAATSVQDGTATVQELQRRQEALRRMQESLQDSASSILTALTAARS